MKELLTGQDEREIRERFRVEKNVLDRFDRCLIEGCQSEWWKLFTDQIRDRMNDFLMMMVNGGLDQRAEDKLRGQILEDSFILTLDERGKGLVKQREGR